ncbi:MAG: type I methionyl aminopeptidase [Clostridia bacterium]|nr:type I methionyl aminopeptidase [Clostridia bacterium]
MIFVKTKEEVDVMRKACRVVRDTLLYVGDRIKEGVTTADVDSWVKEYIESQGAIPSCLGYEGYPASACVSVDDVVVHGIPSKKTYIEEGQIVGVDLCAYIDGYHGDGARTFMIGKVSREKRDLVETAEKAFFKGIEGINASSRLGDISGAIQEYVESRGYSVVRALTGHGIGREMHEDPSVPNYGVKGRGLRLHSGLTLAVEPMINLGRFDVYTERDGWTVRTKDRSPSAHYENTVVIWEDGVEILTL